jgi:hypothetical protein
MGFFFETEEWFPMRAQKILRSQLLWNELEIQFSLPKRTNDSGLKPPEEKNSSIAMELKIGVARARKSFSRPSGSGRILDPTPVHHAAFSSLEEFLNENGFTQAANCKPASLSRVNGSCASVRSFIPYRISLNQTLRKRSRRCGAQSLGCCGLSPTPIARWSRRGSMGSQGSNTLQGIDHRCRPLMSR